MPYIVLMVLLPLILLVCFKNKAQYKHFTLWNNLASCTAALLVTFIGILSLIWAYLYIHWSHGINEYIDVTQCSFGIGYVRDWTLIEAPILLFSSCFLQHSEQSIEQSAQADFIVLTCYLIHVN